MAAATFVFAAAFASSAKAEMLTLGSLTVQDHGALQPGMTREELAAALKDHVKGSAGPVMRFRHPTEDRLIGL